MIFFIELLTVPHTAHPTVPVTETFLVVFAVFVGRALLGAISIRLGIRP